MKGSKTGGTSEQVVGARDDVGPRQGGGEGDKRVELRGFTDTWGEGKSKKWRTLKHLGVEFAGALAEDLRGLWMQKTTGGASVCVSSCRVLAGHSQALLFFRHAQLGSWGLL